MVKPALIADELGEQWRLPRHVSHCASGVALPFYKQDGTLTRGDAEREFRWQEHFAGSSGDSDKTQRKYLLSTSPSRQSRLDPKLSLAEKQRPTLYLYS